MAETMNNDIDFEIVDSSTIQFPTRSRKPKYTHALWEKDDTESQYKNYLAAQRNYKRRHGNVETPYDHHIDEKKEYAKWWSENTIHLVNMEQIERENQSKVVVKIDGNCICNYCGDNIEKNRDVYSWICISCMDTVDYLKELS